MRKKAARWLLVLFWALHTSWAVAAPDKPPEKLLSPTPDRDVTSTQTKAKVPIFKPPVRGAPAGPARIGGGTRGLAKRTVTLSVLTPDGSGLTTQEQPSLFWYLSQVTAFPIEFTLTENRAVKPILEKRLSGPFHPGIQRVRLADFDVRLKPGVQYRWFIAIVPDADNRSKDILAGGFIERFEPPSGMRTRLTQASAAEAPFIYAEEGVWYDALSAISDRIEAAPNDATLRNQRASLLEQVRLREAADYDLKRAHAK